ncbi:hypothetical protein SAMN05216466_107130 [Paraburkholderia phenazinium]|uniref:Uncharacterized protein n=1 Tax=Paraburkholderia phenazinium TaxID=60549 RepID=A0A1G7ZQ97_9BURK|nr:hypothetical protein [Paraburkholderia phenazinium]SDH10891.1 hypothetical protein SAMN05216466_107130 [Paraburkholderia phenazinium]
MSPFEEALSHAAQQSILKVVMDGRWIEPDYANRFKIPADLIRDIYGLVDREALKVAIGKRLEEELADRIVNALAAEIATDIKQILSVKERREEIREVARKHLQHIAKEGV